MQNFWFKKVILTVLIITMVFSPLSARKAEAFIFTDWVNFAVNAISSFGINAMWVKEYALDAVAYKILDLIIQKIAASTVNWINGGFKGSPGFISDPGRYFGDVADGVAGEFIFNEPKLNFLCGPISAKIRLALTTNYLQENMQWQCTLTQVGRNLDDFMNDFNNGGWENFFELTQRQQNSPIGAYLQAENSLSIKIATRQGTKEKELNWGKGFMSLKRCKVWGQSSGSAQTPEGPTDGGFDGAQTPGEGYGQVPDDVVGTTSNGQTCLEEETTTPGTVIENKLNDTLNIGNHKLAVADEINEIINALLNQLTNRIVGGIGAGLRALSRPDSTGNSSFTSTLSNTENDTAINTYFDTSNQQIDDTLDSPNTNYDPYFCRNNPTDPQCSAPPGAPCDVGVDPNCSTTPQTPVTDPNATTTTP